jgi:SpoVK/Ycf46/Vps4 family AAA+-type ATPase
MNNFIQFLDTYKNKKCDYFDLVNIIQMTNINYTENKYYEEIYSHSSNTTNNTINTPSYYIMNNTDNYTLWQQNYTVRIPTPEKEKENNVQNKENKEIIMEKQIHHITDLLNLIENNPYDDSFEYNIDLKTLHTIKPELEELNHMIGMNSVKTSILNQLFYFIQHLHQSTKSSDFKHTVIYGPPGTGKTEIAKIIGRMFSKIGILPKNIFKKVTRTDLIAGYLGQTAIKTKAIIDECLGGVLFIDEAYSLGNSTQSDVYSKECIDTLCEALSDKKENLMGIIAGYEEELNHSFFNMNKGLSSRFIWRYKIEEYTAEELYHIFKKKVIESEWTLSNDSEIGITWFEKQKTFFKHYGRDIELLFSYMKMCHAKNIFGKPIHCRKCLTIKDIEDGFIMFKKNMTEPVKIPFGLYT